MIRSHPVDVEVAARSIARRCFRGSRKVAFEKEKHLINAAEIIRKRWGVGPSEWLAKHVRWFFEIALRDRSSGTRYRYYRYLRTVLIFINRFDNFEPFLNGPWQRP